jgi:hypothetical protein
MALTAQDALTIRQRAFAGEGQRVLAAEYRVSEAAISNIVLGKVYRDAGGPLKERKGARIIKVAPLDRFWAQTERVGDCILWTGATQNGYGALTVGGVSVRAHRWIYEQTKGAIPAGLFILHACDTPTCVNPEHLRAGTQVDNMQDAKSRGRLFAMPGEGHGLHQLSTADVIAIRERGAIGVGFALLAKEYGVSKRTIGSIVRGDERVTEPGPRTIRSSGGRALITSTGTP